MDNVLKNWKDMNKALPDMDEETLRNLLNFELSTSKRPTFINRMYQRYNKLRSKRELDSLTKGEMLL